MNVVGEGAFWQNVYNSIAEQDYNYVAGLPSAALVKLFGESRLVYVLGLVNMYLIPSFILIYLLARKVSKAPKIATVIAILLCPAMVFLAFNGFVDIGGLLMCLICFNLYLKILVYACVRKRNEVKLVNRVTRVRYKLAQKNLFVRVDGIYHKVKYTL